MCRRAGQQAEEARGIGAEARLPQCCVLIADTAALLVRSLSEAAAPSLRSFDDSAGVAVSAVTLRASGAL